MDRLDQLKLALTEATVTRNERVAALKAEIAFVNGEYDRLALRLSREITRLEPIVGETIERPTESKPKSPRQRKPKRDILADVNAWNQEHGLPTVGEY